MWPWNGGEGLRSIGVVHHGWPGSSLVETLSRRSGPGSLRRRTPGVRSGRRNAAVGTALVLLLKILSLRRRHLISSRHRPLAGICVRRRSGVHHRSGSVRHGFSVHMGLRGVPWRWLPLHGWHGGRRRHGLGPTLVWHGRHRRRHGRGRSHGLGAARGRRRAKDVGEGSISLIDRVAPRVAEVSRIVVRHDESP